jgi:hypothetical protein
MSKLIENKHLIHIASEIIVLLGITFYFNQKNKKIMEHIHDLSQRIEDQEDLLQKHEQIIKKLVEFIRKQEDSSNTLSNSSLPNIQSKKSTTKPATKPTPTPTPTPKSAATPKPTPKPTPTKEIHTIPPLVAPVSQKIHSAKVNFVPLVHKTPPMRIEEVESDESEEESDLDTELAEELRELEESDNEEDVDLKKE